jgi:hypothetical protein
MQRLLSIIVAQPTHAFGAIAVIQALTTAWVETGFERRGSRCCDLDFLPPVRLLRWEAQASS